MREHGNIIGMFGGCHRNIGPLAIRWYRNARLVLLFRKDIKIFWLSMKNRSRTVTDFFRRTWRE